MGLEEQPRASAKPCGEVVTHERGAGRKRKGGGGISSALPADDAGKFPSAIRRAPGHIAAHRDQVES